MFALTNLPSWFSFLTAGIDFMVFAGFDTCIRPMLYLEKIAEERIKQAIEKGEFDHLEGFGKPVDNSDYFNAPPDERIAWHILKNAGVVPEEIFLHKKIYHLTDILKQEADPQTKLILQKKLHELQSHLSISLEKRKRH